MPANVKRLCDGGEIEAKMLNLVQMFNQGTNVEISSKAPLLQNRCSSNTFGAIALILSSILPFTLLPTFI